MRRGGEIRSWVSKNLAFIGVVELIAVGLYLLAILIRLRNPDVWDVIWGGEKPMDLTYFTAVLKSTSFPPYDPWFAGGYLNYYYYGFVYTGVLTKLLGIIPTVAYNLNLSMLFSFTGMAVFSIAYDLVAWRREIGDRRLEIKDNLQSPISNLHKKAITAGAIAITLAIFLGNLGQVGVLADAWYKAGNPTLEETIPCGGNGRSHPGRRFQSDQRHARAHLHRRLVLPRLPRPQLQRRRSRTDHRIPFLHLPLRRFARPHDCPAADDVGAGVGGVAGV